FLGLGLAAGSALAQTAPPLSFRLDEGQTINSFTRDGAVAAHLLLRSGERPRLLVAFPAANSGVGLWFANPEKPVTWTLVGSPRPVTLKDGKGRPLRGIEADVQVDTQALRPAHALLSSVRVLRDYEALGRAPDEVTVEPRLENGRLIWARDRLDGAAGYRLSL